MQFLVTVKNPPKGTKTNAVAAALRAALPDVRLTVKPVKTASPKNT